MEYLKLEDALANMETIRKAIADIRAYNEAKSEMIDSVRSLSKVNSSFRTEDYDIMVRRANYFVDQDMRDVLTICEKELKALEESLVEDRACDLFDFEGAFAAKAVRENLGDPIKLYMSVNPERIPEDNQPKIVDFHGITVECIMLAFNDPNGVGGGAIRMVFGRK